MKDWTTLQPRPLITERMAMEQMGPARLRLHLAIRTLWHRYSERTWPLLETGPGWAWRLGALVWRAYRRTWPWPGNGR